MFFNTSNCEPIFSYPCIRFAPTVWLFGCFQCLRITNYAGINILVHMRSVQKVSSHVIGKIETFIEEDTRYKKHCTWDSDTSVPFKVGFLGLLSEHVYCVAIAFKITEQREQWTRVKLCIKLEHSSMETIRMIQKITRCGQLVIGSFIRGQRVCSCIVSHAELFGERSNHPGDSVPIEPRFDTLRLLTFPQTKSPLKGKRFQTVDEIQENMTGQLIVIGRIVWGPKVPTLKGTEVSLSYVQCFLYLLQ